MPIPRLEWEDTTVESKVARNESRVLRDGVTAQSDSLPRDGEELEKLRVGHHRALAMLLRRGMGMRTVRRNRLDDPRISEEERMDRARIHLDRRDYKVTLI